MHALSAVLALLFVPGSSSESSLTETQVERQVAASEPQIRDCYVQHALGVRTATGTLSLQIRISPDGQVADVDVRAPGISGERLSALATCVREEATTWHFPGARAETTAELPYVFQPSGFRLPTADYRQSSNLDPVLAEVGSR